MKIQEFRKKFWFSEMLCNLFWFRSNTDLYLNFIPQLYSFFLKQLRYKPERNLRKKIQNSAKGKKSINIKYPNFPRRPTHVVLIPSPTQRNIAQQTSRRIEFLFEDILNANLWLPLTVDPLRNFLRDRTQATKWREIKTFPQQNGKEKTKEEKKKKEIARE